jgi:hypothetical protein
MADMSKETIYIDVDDEITTVIDKVRGADAKVLALVLPKRASVFQSIVNMKLLKRSADEAKKHLVLITTEAGLLPLAGAVGLHVAKTLNSKPELPAAPISDDREETVEEAADLDSEPEAATAETAGSKPVGELVGLGAAAALAADGVETLELDNDEETPAADTAASDDKKTAAKSKPPKRNKKLHVPNFERFRLLLVIGVLVLAALIVGLIIATKVLPKASIEVQTDASDINTSNTFTLSTTASSLNTSSDIVPAKEVTMQKTFTGSVTTTGQQNNGQKATGSVTISLADCNNSSVTIPAGTGISANSLTYITQNSVTLSSVQIGSQCNPPKFSNIYSQNVAVTAAQGGSNYNIPSGTAMVVASNTGYSSSDLNATSNGAISGGTDDIVQVVAQADIDNATAKINVQNNSVKQSLTQQLQQDNLYAINTTFNAGTPSTTDSAAVGSTANTETVTETVSYSMYGARQSDLQTLIDNSINGQINSSQQGILNDGFDNVSFTANNSSNTNLTMATTAEVGPNINTTTIQQQAAGKKSGDISSAIKNDPNVTGVTVHFSPFWVTTAPTNLSKITVTIAKPAASSNASAP